MLLHRLAITSQQLATAAARRAKIALLVDLLRAVSPPEIGIAVQYLAGQLPQGRLGLSHATVRAAATAPTAHASLELLAVDATLSRLATIHGAGAQARRREALAMLLAQATDIEQLFLRQLIAGELHQGALEAVMIEAIAAAFDVAVERVRRAWMLSGDIAAVAHRLATQGTAGLSVFTLRLFTPVKPMLAQPVADVAGAVAQLPRAAFEYKLDGARVQVHKLGKDVRIFSRTQNDITAALPEIVTAIAELPARSGIWDGEVIALQRDGTPQPFQVTMRRLGRKSTAAGLAAELPLSLYLFDCLQYEDTDLIDAPMIQRWDAIPTSAAVPIMPRLISNDITRASDFFRAAIAAGHEGAMAKDLDAPYAAGRRGGSWLKIKRAHTLDLVVLAAEWGNGRRRGWLSNLHLGARDPARGEFVMLGKTFKGMTDAMLAWQTEKLQTLKLFDDGLAVHVRPELVVEIAFNDIQASPHYPGGLALRFARVKRYRDDKTAQDADTIDTVRDIYQRQSGVEAKV